MPGFIYFLPLDQRQLVVDDRLDAKQLACHGLHDVLDDVCDVPGDCIVTPVTAGPDNQSGCVLFPLSPGADVPKIPGYVPESQKWRRASRYWIGYEGEPPRPEHFERSSVVPGYIVPDRFGRSWHVPLIRGLDRPYGALPCDYEFGDEFLPSEVLRARYRSLWRDSARIWDCYSETSTVAETFVAQFAARCLAINYRLGPAEMNFLAELGQPVFDRENVTRRFAGSAIDAPAVGEYIEQKKTIPSLPVPGGTTSSHGTQVETPTGDQPEGNSD